MKKRRLQLRPPTFILAAFMVQLAFGAPAHAARASSIAAEKVIVLFMGGVSLPDIMSAEAPTLHRLASKGAWAVMNARTASAFSPEAAYATFGSIDRSYGSLEAGAAFETSERFEYGSAAEAFARRTGQSPPAGSIVVLDLPRLLKNNSRLGTAPGIGALGQALEDGAKRVAVLGNADTTPGTGREVALGFMNRQGIVAMGRVGQDLLRPNPRKPFGVETDYPQLAAGLWDLLGRTDCVGVELGDTSRAEKYRDSMLPLQRERMRSRAIADADGFVARVVKHIDRGRHLLLVVSLYPPRDAVDRGDTLPPVLAYGPGFQPGLLYSRSTRRPGVVVLADLQATILSALGVPIPADFQGRPLTSVPQSETLSFLSAENDRIARVNTARGPVLKTFVVAQIVLLVLALGAILLRPRRTRPYRVLRVLLTGITAVPLALLILPAFGLPGTAGTLVYLALWTLAAGSLTFLPGLRGSGAPGLIALVTACTIMVDTAWGAPLMSRSILGYSPVGGARFYGIGNEYMGILLGSSVVGSCVLLDRIGAGRWSWALLFAAFAAWAYVTAAPWIGSNLGGAISLAVTYAVTYLSLVKRDLPPKKAVLYALIGAAALAVLLTAGDFLRAPGTQSHMGRLIGTLLEGGPAAIVPILVRKIAMNVTLVEFTIWPKALLTLVAALGVLFYRPRGKLAEITAQQPSLAKGIRGTVIGSVTAFLVNDSGVVAAATAMLFPVATLAVLVLSDPDERTGPKAGPSG